MCVSTTSSDQVDKLARATGAATNIRRTKKRIELAIKSPRSNGSNGSLTKPEKDTGPRFENSGADSSFHRLYGPQLNPYTPFVLRDFGLVAWLFTNRVRDVRHVRTRRRRVARRVVVGDLRVQQIDGRDGRRSWTIVWPEGTEHAEADRFLRRHEGSGTQRTYAYRAGRSSAVAGARVPDLRSRSSCGIWNGTWASSAPRSVCRWASRGGSASARMAVRHCRSRRPA